MSNKKPTRKKKSRIFCVRALVHRPQSRVVLPRTANEMTYLFVVDNFEQALRSTYRSLELNSLSRSSRVLAGTHGSRRLLQETVASEHLWQTWTRSFVRRRSDFRRIQLRPYPHINHYQVERAHSLAWKNALTRAASSRVYVLKNVETKIPSFPGKQRVSNEQGRYVYKETKTNKYKPYRVGDIENKTVAM